MEGVLENVLLPMVIVGFALMIPIIAILTGHQRKMAELYRQDRVPVVDPRLAAENESLKRELADIKALVYQQAIDRGVGHRCPRGVFQDDQKPADPPAKDDPDPARGEKPSPDGRASVARACRTEKLDGRSSPGNRQSQIRKISSAYS
jgi:hypothetical protein